MKLVISFVLTLFSMTAFAGEYCASSFEGNWKCDTDIFGKNVEIKVIPPGHGLPNGMIALINAETNMTGMSAPLDYAWTSGQDYFAVRGSCTPGNDVKIEFKDREIEYRKASGAVILKFEEFNGVNELHIIDNVKFRDGSDYSLNATCRK